MKTTNELKLLFNELNENPYRRLNFAFILISVIPILTLIYIFCEKSFNNIGFTLFFAGIILILGYVVAYGVMKNIINKTIRYAAKAKKADELKSTFAMALAHDLKSPLVTIKANISNLKAGFLGTLTKEQDEAINVCKDVANRMNTMIMELIDIYMIEAGMAEIKISSFDICGLVYGQIRELAGETAKKNINLTIELPPNQVVMKADKGKIIRALNNLLNNSIKHTLPNGKVNVKISSAESLVKIEFLNTGEFIPEEYIEKIFDKFERLNKSVEGHGLGLSIAKDIVELHNGKIWAESKAGSPNCFTILLPKE
ncbi:MAG: HAMP domain-containing histidine kinase [Candidatus Omnitrophica bacterium]|nr:HAMP domain-containing histidine kinase [Candidatus Omnitrophota bacterium]